MRQFIAPTMPDKQGNLILSGKDFKYLHNVLRLGLGDTIHVRFPSGELRSMSVVSISGKTLCLSFSEYKSVKETGVTASEIEHRKKKYIPLWLFQFMPKAQKMDLIVRQATELGVMGIVPVLGFHCSKDACYQRRDRWERIIREARQQSGSPVETKILQPCSLKDAMLLWQSVGGDNPCGIALYEKNVSTQTFHSAISSDYVSAAAVVSGCEGGIAKDELVVLMEAGFKPLHLETNILRTETATLYGLSVLQTLLTERLIWLLNESKC